MNVIAFIHFSFGSCSWRWSWRHFWRGRTTAFPLINTSDAAGPCPAGSPSESPPRPIRQRAVAHSLHFPFQILSVTWLDQIVHLSPWGWKGTWMGNTLSTNMSYSDHGQILLVPICNIPHYIWCMSYTNYGDYLFKIRNVDCVWTISYVSMVFSNVILTYRSALYLCGCLTFVRVLMEELTIQ